MPPTFSTDALVARILILWLLSTVAFFDSCYISFPWAFHPTPDNNGMFADVVLGICCGIIGVFFAVWLSQPYWAAPKPPEEREHGW